MYEAKHKNPSLNYCYVLEPFFVVTPGHFDGRLSLPACIPYRRILTATHRLCARDPLSIRFQMTLGQCVEFVKMARAFRASWVFTKYARRCDTRHLLVFVENSDTCAHVCGLMLRLVGYSSAVH